MRLEELHSLGFAVFKDFEIRSAIWKTGDGDALPVSNNDVEQHDCEHDDLQAVFRWRLIVIQFVRRWTES